jgi:hypothetical protein
MESGREDVTRISACGGGEELFVLVDVVVFWLLEVEESCCA